MKKIQFTFFSLIISLVATCQTAPYVTTTGTQTLTNKTYSNTVLVGTTTAPTPTISSNTTALATTAFVRSAISFVTPEMYGAVGNGTTNDQAALQSAVNSGYPVYLSANKNYFTATTFTTGDNVTIIGTGKNSVISTTASISILTIQGKNNTIQNVAFQGSSTGTQNGINIDGNAGFTLYYLNNNITGCFFDNFSNNGVFVRNIIGSSSGAKHEGACIISNSVFRGCNNGINFFTRAEYNNVVNCAISSCTVGITITGGNNNVVGSEITDCTTGVQVLSGTNDSHCGITGTKINHNTTNLSCTHQRNYTFTNCQFYVGNISLTGTGKNKFIGCDFYMTGNTLTITNSPAFFYSNEFETVPSTYSLTGTAPVMIKSYTGTALLSTPTITTSNVDLQSGNNLSDVGTANTALNNLLPSQASNSGKFLKTDGTNTSWVNASGTGDLLSSNNLSDVSNTVTARNNILPSKTGNSLKVLRVNAGESDYELVAGGGTGDMLASNNLSDLANKLTARTNLGYTDMILSADVTNTASATPAATTMSFTPTINKRYWIEGTVRVGCNNTGGTKLQITIPTGATMNVVLEGATSGTTARGFSALQTSASLSGTAFGTINANFYYVKFSGEIQMSSTSGTISVEFAPATNTQTSTIYKLGTKLTATLLN